MAALREPPSRNPSYGEPSFEVLDDGRVEETTTVGPRRGGGRRLRTRRFVPLVAVLLVGLVGGAASTTWWVRRPGGIADTEPVRLFAQASSGADEPDDRACVSVLVVLHNLGDHPLTVERVDVRLPRLRTSRQCPPPEQPAGDAVIRSAGYLAYVLRLGLVCPSGPSSAATSTPAPEPRYTAVARSPFGRRTTVTGTVDTSGLESGAELCGQRPNSLTLWWSGEHASRVDAPGRTPTLRLTGLVGSGLSAPDVALTSLGTAPRSAFAVTAHGLPVRLHSDTDRQVVVDITVRDCARARRFADADLVLTATTRPAAHVSGTLTDGPRTLTVALVRLVDASCGAPAPTR
ncbi:hypothetical protein [Actinopolymorpha rutila]|uniref:Uncharacterized protein n=1 Tax=Actinopolymorpha rutila TaxID=446787 RepID=A0A852ZM88_9ACTN|nr:hypothetical protein [Actinopolymorpha rutila]NYH92998.1 hypothetical protein [Actinopolymorpha rutila]